MVYAIAESGIFAKSRVASILQYYSQEPAQRPEDKLWVVKAVPHNPQKEVNEVAQAGAELTAQRFLGIADSPTLYTHLVPHLFEVVPRAKIDPAVARRAGIEYIKPRHANGGWLARMLIAGDLSRRVQGDEHTKKFIAHEVPNQGLIFRGPEPETVTGRLESELGFTEWSQYANAIKELRDARDTIQSGAGDFLQKEVRYIKALLKEIEEGHLQGLQNISSPIPEPILLAELLNRMSLLENERLSAYDAKKDSQGDEIFKALQRLYKEDGLRVEVKNIFIQGRESSGVTLTLEKRRDTSKCIVVKREGFTPHHRAIENAYEIDNPELISADDTEGYRGGLTKLEFVGNGELLTPRYQLQERLESVHEDEPIAKALGIENKIYLVSGIETQTYVEGKDLNQVVSENPDLLTADIYRQLVRIALIHIEHGRDLTDWSFHNFRLQDNGTLRLTDLGTYERNVGEIKGPLERIKNIAHSAKDNQSRILAKVEQLHAEVVGNDPQWADLRNLI